MKNFVRKLHDLARDIHKQKNKQPFYRDNRNLLNKSQSKKCWICENDFNVKDGPESTIDLDHCHFSGKFLGWAHEKCNRARRYVNFIPVVGHNIQNYNLHHICLAINKCEPTTTVQVIPATDEKYMIFGVLIETITTDEGKTKKIYKYLQFIDSYKMMNSSLEKLTKILPTDQFGILNSMFPGISESDLELLKQKDRCPYSYVSDRNKFLDTTLPTLENWRNTLEGGAVSTNETELEHAQKVWEILHCSTLQDYHDGYLKLDFALLACVCEFHRELSFKTYKLDCMHFYTLPNMAKEASLQICKAEVEFLTDRDYLDLIEPAVRGGVIPLSEERRLVANICYLDNYDASKE